MLPRATTIRPLDTVPARVELVGEEGARPDLPSVSLTLEDSSAMVWRVELWAEVLRGKHLYLGGLLTYPPAPGQPTRCIAQASCPGAKRWMASIVAERRPPAPAVVNNTRQAELTIAACPDLLTPGLTVPPAAGIAIGERPGFVEAAIAGNGTVVIDPAPTTIPRRIVKLSVYQVGTGGQIGFNSPWLPTVGVVLPPNGALTWDFGPGVLLPFEFAAAGWPAGGGGFVAEYRW